MLRAAKPHKTPRAARNPQAERRREYHALMIPVAVEMRRAGSSPDDIAARLNAEFPTPFKICGYPWDGGGVLRLLRRHMDPAERQKIATVRVVQSRLARPGPGWERIKAVVIPRALELRRERFTYDEAADTLNREGLFDRKDNPWTGGSLQSVVSRHIEAAGLEVEAIGVPKRGEIAHLKARRHNEAIVKEVVAWYRDGATFRKMAERLNARETLNSERQPWLPMPLRLVMVKILGEEEYAEATKEHYAAILRRRSPIKFGVEGGPIDVLRPDGKYEEAVGLGQRRHVKSRWESLKAISDAGPRGLTERQLRKLGKSAKAIKWLKANVRILSAMIMAPDADGDWRIATPNRIDDRHGVQSG